jgi:hypothetical protein
LVSENISYRAVFSEIAKTFGKKEPYIKISKFLSGIAWRVVVVLSSLTGNEPLLTKHTSKSIHRVSKFSNAKIKSSIGIVFNPISTVIERVCANF